MLTLGGLKDDYSLLSPLTGLMGRNGGLSLKSRWEALWAMGVKVVSLKSTFWGFWVDRVGGLVALGGRIGVGRPGRVNLALYMRRSMVGGVGLYTAGGAHLGCLMAFGGCAALPVLLGV